jgi:pyruvate,water dikinase
MDWNLESRMVDTVARWERPGVGTWQLDSSHCGPAPSPIYRELMEEAVDRGMSEGMHLFGSPLRTMQLRWVNGKFYRRLVPIVGGSSDMKPPPGPILWLVARLHPAFRREERKARESFETKRWRDELRRWETEWKPALVAANLGFTDVDVHSLTDAELASHVSALHEHLRESTALHFRLHVSDMGPLGMLMVHVEDCGLHRDDTFRALVSASPATRAPAAQLGRIAEAVRAAGVDLDSVSSLDQVRSTSPEAAASLDEYLRFHGWRLTTGYEIEDRCLIELQDVVLASIRGAVAKGDDGEPAALAALHGLRAEVPAAKRAEFDELVEDARLSYGLRDENGPITYEWPAGLLRRALLEARARLAVDVFELKIDEVVAMLSGGDGPGLDAIAERAAERKWWATLEAPATLGPEETPPNASLLPTYLGRFTRIVLTVVDALEADPAAEPLTGTGIGTTTYTGRARVVRDAAEALATMEPGDVLVAPYTAPTYNAVLSMAGGLVTEEGGLLCHAAVIARELGLPAVIGAVDAMARIPAGATVELDPLAGRVTVLPA